MRSRASTITVTNQIPYEFPWYERKSWTTIALGEFLGTFFLVYVISLCVTLAPIEAVTPIGIGGAIFALCNIFGDLTGAHFNPCITLPLYLVDNRFSFTRCVIYILSETSGAIIGVQVGSWTANGLGNPYSWAAHAADNYSLLQIMVCEAVLTCMLSLTALRAGFLQHDPNPLCPLWVAGAVVAGSYAGGPVSGTCINPALAVGWVIADGSLWDLIPYGIGPLTGSVSAAAIVMFAEPSIYHRRVGAYYVITKDRNDGLSSYSIDPMTANAGGSRLAFLDPADETISRNSPQHQV